MFQAGGLIFFCGLLALPLPVELASDPTSLVKNLTNTLSNGLVSAGLLDTITNLPDILGAQGNSLSSLLGPLIQKWIPALNPLKGTVDINITDPEILELGLVPSKDGRRLFLHIPLNLIITVQVPILKIKLVKLSLKLNTTLEIFPEKDGNNETHLVIGDCTNPPGKLEATVLEGFGTALPQLIADSITKTLNTAVPQVVQRTVCPIVNEALSFWDISQVQEIINTLIPAKSFVFTI